MIKPNTSCIRTSVISSKNETIREALYLLSQVKSWCEFRGLTWKDFSTLNIVSIKLAGSEERLLPSAKSNEKLPIVAIKVFIKEIFLGTITLPHDQTILDANILEKFIQNLPLEDENVESEDSDYELPEIIGETDYNDDLSL